MAQVHCPIYDKCEKLKYIKYCPSYSNSFVFGFGFAFIHTLDLSLKS